MSQHTQHEQGLKNHSQNKNSVVVSKFGGSSMADADAIRRSAGVAVNQGSSVVVVSATYGTTNRLVEMVDAADNGDRKRTGELIAEIRESHDTIAHDLAVTPSTRDELQKLLDTTGTLAYELDETVRKSGAMTPPGTEPDMDPVTAAANDPSDDHPNLNIQRLRDRIFGMGERMSSLLITDYLNQSGHPAAYLDAGNVIRTDDRYARAIPQFEVIEELCERYIRPLLSPTTTQTANQKRKEDRQHKPMQRDKTESSSAGHDSGTTGRIVVTQGFIGRTSDGHDTTLGRGGSDYSAAILAWGLNADVLQIWTDVNGMATTDPRVVPQAKMIPEISFQEAAELATFGAKILHPSTLIPAIWKEIPVFVGSSLRPDDGGTWIYRDVGDAPLVRALAIRRKQALLTLTTPQMLHTYGFLYRIFKVFNDHQVSVDSITTSEISVAMTVDDHTLKDKALISDLEELGRLQIEESYELISLIGNNINHTAGLAQKVFTALSDINVRMICQGASRHNFCFLVSEGRGEEAIRKLHSTFIG